MAHEWGHIDFENVNSDGMLGYPAAGWLTYGRTKLANIYFTYELHRRLREFGGDGGHVDVNCVHPGGVWFLNRLNVQIQTTVYMHELVSLRALPGGGWYLVTIWCPNVGTCTMICPLHSRKPSTKTSITLYAPDDQQGQPSNA